MPHRDILDGTLALETYAAKLIAVHDRTGPAEYVDSKAFFERTYETKNLLNIVKTVKRRLEGHDVDHFHPLQTRFGGGKTHTLIYLYHKFVEWYGKAPVVIVGTELDPNTQTIWGEIEKQLTGNISKLTSQVPHGSAAIKSILEQHQPTLILIDELLHYIGKAEGIPVGKSTLAEQTIAFVQDLGDAIMDLKNTCVVATLPSSASEQIGDEKTEALFTKLKNFAGRIADVVSPVDDTEVPSIIRTRLFQTSEKEITRKSSQVISEFVTYCEEEGILPEGTDKTAYRKRFEKSYPFQPEVIDVLYHRWGSIQNFQRTRGVLRLLSIVVHTMLKSNQPFISLGDFELENARLREELAQYLDDQFQSVIAQDIVGPESGAAKVDRLMPPALIPKKLGTRAATVIFMYSHSGSVAMHNEQTGATETEIMRSTVTVGMPSANVSSVLEKFRNHLFYLTTRSGTYIFTKEANLLKMKLEKMENISKDEMAMHERQLLQRHVLSRQFAVHMWPTQSRMVKDSDDYKIVVLKEPDMVLMTSILNTVGETPRKYRNNMFFLTVLPTAKTKFQNAVRSKIAWEYILKETQLTDEQRSMIRDELQKDSTNMADFLKEYYSCLYLPESNTSLGQSLDEAIARPLEPHEITVPIYTSLTIDQILYNYLKQEFLFVERIGPEYIDKNYLVNKQFVRTLNLYESMLTSPGEIRPASKEVLSHAIRAGVAQKMFGIGVIESDNHKIMHFGDTNFPVTFSPEEVIITKALCHDDRPSESFVCDTCGMGLETDADLNIHAETHRTQVGTFNELKFSFTLPAGTANYASDMFLLIASKFKDIHLTLSARNGSVSAADIENLRETLRQMNSTSDLFHKYNGQSPATDL